MPDKNQDVREKEPFGFPHNQDKKYERSITKDIENEWHLKKRPNQLPKEYKAKRKSPALMRAFY